MESTKRFRISGFDLDQKVLIEDKIKRLGDCVIDDEPNTFNHTHLILHTFEITTNLLASLVSGKFILTVDYIDKSFDAGRWLDEIGFEWHVHDVHDGLVDSNVVQSCRHYVKLNQKGLFANCAVLIGCKDQRYEQAIGSVLTAGGAQIYNEDQVETAIFSDPIEITHIVEDQDGSVSDFAKSCVDADASHANIDSLYHFILNFSTDLAADNDQSDEIEKVNLNDAVLGSEDLSFGSFASSKVPDIANETNSSFDFEALFTDDEGEVTNDAEPAPVAEENPTDRQVQSFEHDKRVNESMPNEVFEDSAIENSYSLITIRKRRSNEPTEVGPAKRRRLSEAHELYDDFIEENISSNSDSVSSNELDSSIEFDSSIELATNFENRINFSPGYWSHNESEYTF